nr:uncharacterized protein LOC127294530 isoform X4 [Lolium perenne]
MDSDGDPHPHTPNPAEEKARKKSIKRARKRELQKLKLQQGPSELHKEDPQISPPGALLQTPALRLAAFLKIKQGPSELHKEGRPETSGPAIGEQAGVEDNAGKVSGSEGPKVTDLPEFKVLALNEGHPKPELTDSSKEGDTANSETESEVVVEEEPKDESDCDSEEEWRKFREYKKRMFDKDFAPQSATQAAASDKNSAVENVTEYSGVAEWADRSYLTWQKSLLVCSEAQHTMVAPSSDEPPSEVSDEDIIQNGEKWMSDEVMVAFNEYIKRTDKLRELEYCFEKLCHQCFNVECYFKIFHHFNFTVKTKHPSSDDWKSITYFAELKEIFGEKYYFCCPLESSENGQCYACSNQGVDDLRHPATGGFERGLPDTVFPYM